MRETFKLIYRSLMTFLTVVLGGGAFLAWWNATPANQLMLIAGILSLLTLMAGLSIFKLDWMDAEAEQFRSIIQSMPKPQINVGYAEPEVHRVDAAMLEEAKRMAAQGVAIDDICRAIDPGYDRQDAAHQGAFRCIVRAMIEQA